MFSGRRLKHAAGFDRFSGNTKSDVAFSECEAEVTFFMVQPSRLLQRPFVVGKEKDVLEETSPLNVVALPCRDLVLESGAESRRKMFGISVVPIVIVQISFSGFAAHLEHLVDCKLVSALPGFQGLNLQALSHVHNQKADILWSDARLPDRIWQMEITPRHFKFVMGQKDCTVGLCDLWIADK